MATKAVKKNRKPDVRYIANAKGKKTEAVLPIWLYEQRVEQAEELQDIRDFDNAMKKPVFVPWEEAKKQLIL